MSHNTLLLEFKGRKSGRVLSTPISYYLKDGCAFCFTNKSYVWWKNLTNGKTVSLLITGKTYQSQPIVEAEIVSVKASELRNFLIEVPRDARSAGVELDPSGLPIDPDILRAAPSLVSLKFPLESI